ncbi:MAG: DUF5989 family protein [Gemmatimonadaceae bacterium]
MTDKPLAVEFPFLNQLSDPLFLREFRSYLMSRKRYWLLPLLIFVGILAVLVFLGQRREVLAPFVYSQRISLDNNPLFV